MRNVGAMGRAAWEMVSSSTHSSGVDGKTEAREAKASLLKVTQPGPGSWLPDKKG